MAAAALGLLLAGCHRQQAGVAMERRLNLSVDPAPPSDLPSGTLVRITARPEPAAQMEWVSGTVKIFHAPVLAFKPDPKDGSWKFRTMVPPMVTVPPGTYAIKAWGRTRSGEEVRGEMNYEVK